MIFLSLLSGTDIFNLTGHALNSYYLASTSGPSFLNRLQGISSGNDNGIESLVNLQELSQQGIVVKEKSVVDYIYFLSVNEASCNDAPSGMPSWFRLDSEDGHLSTYQVSCAS